MSPVARAKNKDKAAADRIASQLVRARGYCQYPGCGRTDTLQCCHIIGRTYAHTRTRLDNLLCLCGTHHNLIDAYPDEKLGVTQHVFGEGHYMTLKITAETTVGQRFDWSVERARLEAIARDVVEGGWA